MSTPDPWAVVGEDVDPWAVVGESAPDRGFLNNAVRGAGQQTLQVIGGVPQAVGGLVGVLAPETGRAIQQIGNDIASVDTGYVPRATWDAVKNAQGFLDTLGAAGAFALEQGIGSAPQVAAMLTGPIGAGTVIAGNTGRLATERAQNDGGQFATPGGIALSAPVAAMDTLADRFVLGRVLPAGGIPIPTAAGRVAGAAVLGGVSEWPQEFAENAVTTAGTQRGFSLPQAVDAGNAGLVAGLGMGGGVRTGVEAATAARQALSPAPNIDMSGWDVVGETPAVPPAAAPASTTPPLESTANAAPPAEPPPAEPPAGAPAAVQPPEPVVPAPAQAAPAGPPEGAAGPSPVEGPPPPGAVPGGPAAGVPDPAALVPVAPPAAPPAPGGDSAAAVAGPGNEPGAVPAGRDTGLTMPGLAAGIGDSLRAALWSGYQGEGAMRADPIAQAARWASEQRGHPMSQDEFLAFAEDWSRTPDKDARIALLARTAATPMPAPAPAAQPTAASVPAGPAPTAAPPAASAPLTLNQALAVAGYPGKMTRAEASALLARTRDEVSGRAGLTWGQLTPAQQSEVVARLSAPQQSATPTPAPAPVVQPAPAPAPAPQARRQTTTTAAGRRVDTEFQVVDLGSLQAASGDLQPRDRAGRASSDVQIAEMASNLDPARLIEGVEADRGAPIVGPDNIVESGNGRVAAIRRAADQHPDKYDAYRAALQAAGYDTTGVARPVLVRRRTTEMTPDERRQFVVEANQSAAMALSATEQAQADAKRLDDGLMALVNPDADLGAAANRKFVEAFVARVVPAPERNGVVDAQGNISAAGMRRVQGALLARAYSDTGTLARQLEATDESARGLAAAMLALAPAWAQMRASVAAGRVRPEFDVTEDLLRAADMLRVMQERGQRPSDVLRQQDMLNPLDPKVELLFRAMSRADMGRVASKERITDILRRYLGEARQQTPDPGLFGNDLPSVTPADALRNALEGPQASLFAPAADTLLDTTEQVTEQAGVQDTRTPTGTGEPAFRDVSYTDEASVYRQAFRDAGLDPDIAANMPGERQLSVLSALLNRTFGINVQVDPRANIRKSIDQMLDAYRNLQFMAHILGLPTQSIGLGGKLNLELLSQRGMLSKYQAKALGLYDPTTRTIALPDRSNSFAHEWAHAVDHELADRVKNLPDAFLSRVARDTGLDPTQPVEAAFVRVMNAMFFNDAKLATRVLALQMDAAKVDAAGNPTKGAQEAQAQLDKITAGNSQLLGPRSEFFQHSGAIGAASYFRNPAEMLARAWEAYTAARVEAAGGTNEFITKGDASYLGEADARLARTFPKRAERDAIFHAMDNLVDALRREGVLGRGPAAARPADMDIVDPAHWDRIAPPNPAEPKGLRAALRREVAAWKNGLSVMRERAGLAGNGAPVGTLPLRTRVADTGRFLGYSLRGQMRVLVERTPAGPARRALQTVMDQLATDPGRGRYVGETFEGAVETTFRRNVNRLTNVLERHGLEKMTEAEKGNLRDLLISASTTPASPAIGRAAGELRAMLDAEWYRNTKAGIQVGYWARNGWLPRLFRDEAIWADPSGFQQDARRVYGVIFDNVVGAENSPDTAQLLQKVRDIQTEVKARQNMSQAAGTGVGLPMLPNAQELLGAEVWKQVVELRRMVSERKAAEDANDSATVARLDGEIAQLAPDVHAAVKGVWTRLEAEAWTHRLQAGHANDYDTRGPDSQYTQARKLPPETDKLLEKWLVNDPVEAVSTYLFRSSRRVAYAERFGADSKKLDAWLAAAVSPELPANLRANPEDVRSMRRAVEVIAGRNRTDIPSALQRATTFVNVAGTLALLPRAVWSSIAEPITIYARTRDAQIAVSTLASGVHEVLRGATWRERAEVANALGIITAPLYDTVLMNRLSGSYGDSPRSDALLANFFRRTGLTQITNAQRRMALSGAHQYLQKMSASVLDTNAKPAARDIARAELRELGIPDRDMDSFAEWMAQTDRMPDVGDLQSAQGRLYATAATRFVDQTIQNPTKVDRPEFAAHPVGRLVYGITAFSYAFWRNVIAANALRVQRDARIRQDHGASAPAAWGASASGMAMHAAVFGGSMFLAQLLTTIVRESLFNGDRWDEKATKDELGSWLTGLAFSRMGVTGPLDPLVQAATGLRYERDLTALTTGPHLGFFLGAAQNVLAAAFGRNSAGTNTAEWNAVKGGWQMFGVPLTSWALTSLPGGAWAGTAIGLALQKATSNEAADSVANALVGEKDSRRAARERASRGASF